jgi:hypothetical protein
VSAAEVQAWVTLAETGATTLATGVLAWFTWVMATATDRMAKAAREPDVVATIEPTRWSKIHLDLVVENTGPSAAYDVTLDVQPPLYRDQGNSGAEDVPISLRPITVLRSRSSLRNFIGSGVLHLERNYTLTVSWKSSPRARERTSVSYELNIQHYEGLITLGGGDPQVQIAQEMQKLREAVKDLATGWRRLEVNVHTEAERERERGAKEVRLQEFERAPTQTGKPEGPPTQKSRRTRRASSN